MAMLIAMLMQAGLNPAEIKFQRQSSALLAVESSFCLNNKLLLEIDSAQTRKALEVSFFFFK